MPYSSQHKSAFWKTCREDDTFLAADLYSPQHMLQSGNKIATAGSCFAQNIGRYIRQSDLEFVDVEPAPLGLPDDVAKDHGFGLYSARYGNIYTARQLRQLLQDAVTGTVHEAAIWKKDGRYYDGLRPSVEPAGYANKRELRAHRRDHLVRVLSIFEQADMFIFTLGLTETWQDTETGIVFPSVPGVVAGTFDADRHSLVNLRFKDVFEDMSVAIELMREISPDIQILLTVSPVPLTATATDQHVLAATTYSKSVLRTVAEELSIEHDFVDYFPSYEMITAAPFVGTAYAPNLRSVRADAVARVMSVFFGAYPDIAAPDMDAPAPIARPDMNQMDDQDALHCDELMLEIFAKE